MKKRIYLNGLLAIMMLASTLFYFSSCSGDTIYEDDTYIDVVTETYSVAIDIVGEPTADEAEVKFTPEEGVAKVVYALATESERYTFISEKENFTDAVTVEGDNEFNVKFDDLVSGAQYTVFAVAYDQEGHSYAVASTVFDTYDTTNFNFSLEYVSDTSIGIRITSTNKYAYFKYALVTEPDSEAFISGELKGIKKIEDATNYVIHTFNLEPKQKYYFYCKGYDRTGNSTILLTDEFTTYASDKTPNITVEPSLGIITSIFNITPNELCGKVEALAYFNGQYDTTFFGNYFGAGEIFGLMSAWVAAGEAKESSGTNFGLNIVSKTYGFERPISILITVYDKNMQPASVKYYNFKTPEFIENVGLPGATLSVENITSSGADYVFTGNENTAGVIFETYDQDNYDMIDMALTLGMYTEFMVAKMLVLPYAEANSFNKYWAPTNGSSTPVRYVEDEALSGTAYHVVAFPVSINGPEGGYGPMIHVPYTTN